MKNTRVKTGVNRKVTAGLLFFRTVPKSKIQRIRSEFQILRSIIRFKKYIYITISCEIIFKKY